MRFFFRLAATILAYFLGGSSIFGFAQAVKLQFGDIDAVDGKVIYYENLKPVPPGDLNANLGLTAKVLARSLGRGTNSESGAITYHVNGAKAVRVGVLHRLGTFAIKETNPLAARTYPYTLGGVAADVYTVYHSLDDDTLYLNHQNLNWCECVFDRAKGEFCFKNSTNTFSEADLGTRLKFYGVNVYIGASNMAFKLVKNCKIKVEGGPISVFADPNKPEYYRETIEFSLPENIDVVKLTFSDVDEYKDDTGAKQQVRDKQEALLVEWVEFEGAEVKFGDHSYKDDVIAKKLKEVEAAAEKRAQNRKKASREKKARRSRKTVTVEKHIHQHVYEPAEQKPQDLVMVDSKAEYAHNEDASDSFELAEEVVQVADWAAAEQMPQETLPEKEPLPTGTAKTRKGQSTTKGPKAQKRAKHQKKAKRQKGAKRKKAVAKKSSKKGKARAKVKPDELPEPPEESKGEQHARALGYFYLGSTVFVMLLAAFEKTIQKTIVFPLKMLIKSKGL